METKLRAAARTWVVTGAAGFIGSHLVERLLSLGQRVVGIDNFSTGKRENLAAIAAAVGQHASERFHFEELDICDQVRVEQVLCAARPDVVLHQAARGSVPRSIAEPLQSHHSNVNGFIVLLDAARRAGTKRFVYASSSSVYGDIPDSPKVEDRLGEPLSPYAATKRINEIYAQVFGRTYGMETIGLRYFNVFGPRQDPNGQYAAVIPRWRATLERREQCTVFGDGSTSRDFCYVANVVQANLLAGVVESTSAAVNQVLNIGCGATTSLRELFELLRAAVAQAGGVDRCVLPDLDFQPFRSGDILHSKADISRAQAWLRYHPTHTLAEGIAEMIAS
jgi:UDP-N-acetylglucosamine 4-epimerase